MRDVVDEHIDAVAAEDGRAHAHDLVAEAAAERVAVALSVDGLNTIDARHTSPWNASKWVLEPYETITIGGWQMSSERARRI